jgi:hypothetical protein
MPNECENVNRILKRVQNDIPACHAELVSASPLGFGFDLKFELYHLTFFLFA